MFSGSVPSVHSTASCFQPLLLQALGEMTQLRLGFFVPYQDVIDRVVSLTGFDLTTLSIPRKSLSPQGLDRKITIAFRCFRESSPPLTQAGPERGFWGLTKEGIQKARPLCPSVKEESNPSVKKEGTLTDEWFRVHFPNKNLANNDFYQTMVAAVRRNLTVSVEAQQEIDHVHACIRKWLHRDAFAKKIEQGASLTPSHLAAYAVRASWTDVRDSAKNPLSREFWGARTPKELKNLAKPLKNPVAPVSVSWHDMDTDSPTWDLHDSSVGNALSEIEDFERLKVLLNELYRRLRVLRHNAKPALHTVVLRMQGNKVSEIAEKMQKTNRQVTRLLSEVKRVLGDEFKAYLKQG